MARSSILQTQKISSLLLNQLFIFFLFPWPLPQAKSISFNFSSLQRNHFDSSNLICLGNASSDRLGLQLTSNLVEGPLNYSVGRALYYERVHLYDKSTGWLTDFTTQFSFIISVQDSVSADGLAFFIAPFVSEPPGMPNNSAGGCLGLFNYESALNATENQIVAVEFDTYKNDWDPSANHIGIDVNSIVSDVNVTWNSSFSNGSTANAWVSYNSSTKNLSVFLTFANNPVFNGNSSLSYTVDLRTVFPEWVSVGFSAATGDSFETHTILSWSFNSTSDPKDANSKNKLGLIIGLAMTFGVVSCALGLLWFICWRKRANGNTQNFGEDVCMNIEFEKGTGPKSFTYREIIHATNNFAEGGKLGEGGFGGVYKGLLNESNLEVAVKRVSKGSKQGKKEYISEVSIISRLRHRNLVQLIGWCHEQGELLLVYEYLPNGSLDTHLFGVEIMLIWPVRYKIALGLASALLYLHEEWEQCVLHRDIKSSNVMLDSNFNAKLGDFGLARLVDQELGSQTTVLAGTMGYLAPECIITGKVSKESDVYSFGVVSLEIACGRKSIQPKAEPNKVSLVEWVWNLYGKDQLIEAVDKRLSMEYDEEQMERLVAVGLWCCHPNPTIRPSIRQVINVLSFETPLPILPSKLPVPMYFEPPIDMSRLSSTSSSITGPMKGHTLCSSSSWPTNSSTLVTLANSSKGNVELSSLTF